MLRVESRSMGFAIGKVNGNSQSPFIQQAAVYQIINAKLTACQIL